MPTLQITVYTKESGLPGLMVDVYIHLRLVSLPLIDLAASSICNLYMGSPGWRGPGPTATPRES